ncbi:putative CCR4-associated factor 1-like protein 10 [Hibiscus syriacus]|uniref:poly(A)-specific ribonuclease n=1 Tax=Hibiscus syriacus TaxID=106335 RepID=A0A6A3ACD7_HIBSY|nr:putative CCR4-associated factor 1-like protein 10 [Hibiscus syriacus]
MSNFPTSESVQIREVWDENLASEIRLIRTIVDKYPYIAMDTEFPGTVVVPTGTSNNIFDYETMKLNVDMLKMIQLGLTFSDAQGNLPTCGTDKHCVWQFNFNEFDPQQDAHQEQSIKLLSESGIDFKKNKEKGVSFRDFGELLMSSGVVSNHKVHWVVFHSGYDIGYSLKLLTGTNLPRTKQGFFDLVRAFFPNIYDVKHMITRANGVHGSLKNVAEQLQIERIGPAHQAGSDSLVTCRVFMRLKARFFGDRETEKLAGVLFWLGAVDQSNEP